MTAETFIREKLIPILELMKNGTQMTIPKALQQYGSNGTSRVLEFGMNKMCEEVINFIEQHKSEWSGE